MEKITKFAERSIDENGVITIDYNFGQLTAIPEKDSINGTIYTILIDTGYTTVDIKATCEYDIARYLSGIEELAKQDINGYIEYLYGVREKVDNLEKLILY